MTAAQHPGRLVVVVGPSGVGKDSLLAGAREVLGNDAGIRFPRRVVTRAPDLGGEDYIALDEAAFLAEQARGAFALSWAAHGLHYGVPRAIEDDLRAGIQVVVNVSRAILPDLRQLYANRLIIGVTASPGVLRQRLEARGRESPADIVQRLARAAAFDLSGDDVAILANDGPLEQGAARLVTLLVPARSGVEPGIARHPMPDGTGIARQA